MYFTDFLLMNAQILVSLAIALIVVWLFSGWVIRNLEDADDKRAFRLGRNALVIVMLAVTVITLTKRAAVHLPRTTIDRSVGDESYEKLQNDVEKGESR